MPRKPKPPEVPQLPAIVTARIQRTEVANVLLEKNLDMANSLLADILESISVEDLKSLPAVRKIDAVVELFGAIGEANKVAPKKKAPIQFNQFNFDKNAPPPTTAQLEDIAADLVGETLEEDE